jgi:hypothetical protein
MSIPTGALTPTEAQHYLESQSGLVPVLTEALAEICIQRPADPFQWLAAYLLKNNPNSPPESAKAAEMELPNDVGDSLVALAPSDAPVAGTLSAAPAIDSAASPSAAPTIHDAGVASQPSTNAAAHDVTDEMHAQGSDGASASHVVEAVTPADGAAAPIDAVAEDVLHVDGSAASSSTSLESQDTAGSVQDDISVAVAPVAQEVSAAAGSSADAHTIPAADAHTIPAADAHTIPAADAHTIPALQAPQSPVSAASALAAAPSSAGEQLPSAEKRENGGD